MILSDVSIRKALADGRIIIEPLDDDSIQPSSVDLHVDRYFRVFRNDTTPYIDPKEPQENLTELVEVSDEGAFILHPGEFVLGSTFERVALPDDLVARLEGKSSLGRLGLLIHSTAGFVDAGWDGHLTLELSNVANLPIAIYPGMKIGQISFLEMTTPAAEPYGSKSVGSKYQGQRGPTPSRYYLNFERPKAPDRARIPLRIGPGGHNLRMAYGPSTTLDPTNVMGRRIAAWFIDVIVPTIVAIILGYIVFIGAATKITGVPSDYCTFETPEANTACIQVGNNAYVGTRDDVRAAFTVGGLVYLIGALNLFVVQGVTGATVGKHMLGLRVVRADGSIAGFGANAANPCCSSSTSSSALVGLITALVTHPHRRVGDMAAGHVRRRESSRSEHRSARRWASRRTRNRGRRRRRAPAGDRHPPGVRRPGARHHPRARPRRRGAHPRRARRRRRRHRPGAHPRRPLLPPRRPRPTRRALPRTTRPAGRRRRRHRHRRAEPAPAPTAAQPPPRNRRRVANRNGIRSATRGCTGKPRRAAGCSSTPRPASGGRCGRVRRRERTARQVARVCGLPPRAPRAGSRRRR